MVIANTGKGNEIVDTLLSDSAKLKREPIGIAIRGNDNLRHPSSENADRKIFQKEFSSNGFNKTFKRTKGSIVLAKRKIRKVLSKVVKKILRRA